MRLAAHHLGLKMTPVADLHRERDRLRTAQHLERHRLVDRGQADQIHQVVIIFHGDAIEFRDQVIDLQVGKERR